MPSLRALRTALLLAALHAAAAHATGPCPPRNETAESLQALKARGWPVVPEDRTAFALAMTACLASPDPILRDDLGYESLAALLRPAVLDTAGVLAVRERLLAMLAEPDPEGVLHPFVILALAEVAQRDRRAPAQSLEQRDELVAVAARFLTGVRDYRGFDEKAGWRHGVAHGADLVLQLALDASLKQPQGDVLLDALLSQVMPKGHAYVFGEPNRLAAATYYLAGRSFWTADAWKARMERLLAARGAVTTVQGLQDRHNLGALATALALRVQRSPSAPLRDQLQGAVDALLGAD